MKGLFLKLPPLAPDYSGVGSVLFELGGVVVIHDGTGCTGNYICHDEPRGFGGSSAIYTSNLRELEVVMGDDEDLLFKLEGVIRDLEPNFLALLSSPAPMVIGTDIPALARILEKRTSCPVLPFDTHGIAFYDQGQAEAMLALAKRFSRPPGETAAPYDINILGGTPLSLGCPKQMDALIALFHELGYPRISSWCMSGDFPAIQAGAKYNYVVSASGLPAARWLEKEYGTPCIAGIPVGEAGIKRLKCQLSGKKFPGALGPGNGRKALVLHEQFTANSWREALLWDGWAGDVNVASFFGMEPGLTRPGDIHLTEEDELVAAARQGKYDIILADELLREMLTPYCRRFVPLPHLAISACFHWNHDFVAIGQAADDYLEKHLG
ncbi:MAG: nitrogenase component 1 [Peptococcaceae bacterium]|nr:nitrogenase component 1 [Peptococcaceae bacterium]